MDDTTLGHVGQDINWQGHIPIDDRDIMVGSICGTCGQVWLNCHNLGFDSMICTEVLHAIGPSSKTPSKERKHVHKIFSVRFNWNDRGFIVNLIVKTFPKVGGSCSKTPEKPPMSRLNPFGIPEQSDFTKWHAFIPCQKVFRNWFSRTSRRNKLNGFPDIRMRMGYLSYQQIGSSLQCVAKIGPWWWLNLFVKKQVIPKRTSHGTSKDNEARC